MISCAQAQTPPDAVTDLTVQMLPVTCPSGPPCVDLFSDNQTVTVDDLVTISFQASDGDGDTIFCRVTFISKPSTTVSDWIDEDCSTDITFTADVAGAYIYEGWIYENGAPAVFAGERTVTANSGSPPPPPPPPPPGGGNFTNLANHLPSPGNWALVSNTAFSTWPDGSGGLIRNTDYSQVAEGNFGSNAVLIAWNGAAWNGSCMYLHGGGHNAYDGTEVYELCLDDPGPRLQMLGSPPDNGTDPNHTYDGFEWCGGELWSLTGFGGSGGLSRFDFGADQWVRHDSGGSYTMSTCWDNVLLVLEGRSPGSPFRHRNSVNGAQIKQAGSVGHLDNGVANMYNGKMYIAHQWGSTNRILSYDPVTDTTDFQVTVLPAGLNYQSGWAVRGDTFVFWDGTNGIWIYDVLANSWQGLAPSGGPTLPAEMAGQNLVFSKWVYIPELDAFAGYNHPDEGLWLWTPINHNPPQSSIIFQQDFATMPPYGAISGGPTEGWFINNFASSCPSPCPVTHDNGTLRISPNGTGNAQYHKNFLAEAGAPIWHGDSVFVKWDQKFDQAYIDGGANPGWKQLQLTEAVPAGTCTSDEIVVQNIFNRGFPQMYHRCPGSPSVNFEESFGSSGVDWQPPSRDCTNQSQTGCFVYVADVWHSFQLEVHVTASGNDTVRFWGKREGDTVWTEIIEKPGNIDLITSGYGRVILTAFEALAGNTWFDNLVISGTMVPAQ